MVVEKQLCAQFISILTLVLEQTEVVRTWGCDNRGCGQSPGGVVEGCGYLTFLVQCSEVSGSEGVTEDREGADESPEVSHLSPLPLDISQCRRQEGGVRGGAS